ncbi:MAG: protein kinase [Proteobacteria bacterium]|nr:protein kinase [Pseudomonadota bacterium]
MTKLGKYCLEQKLASGGMGTIWVAYDEQLQRQVAVKLMLKGRESTVAQRNQFEREAQLVARLQHPHVVQIYDYGIDDSGASYTVMELLEGEDLSTRLERTQTMSLTAFAPLFLQAAKALDAAHRAGIVHQDLKPANIFLAQQGAEFVVKILDFGVAAMCGGQSGDSTHSGTPSLIGTPYYMSPEQARMGEVGYRSDLWSLAVVAYRVLTGALPFTGSELNSMLRSIQYAPHLPPSSRVPELGLDVDAFFERALAKDPASRFQSALEMAAAFSEIQQSSWNSIRILVVDDEPDLAPLMRKRFRQQIRDKVYEFIFALTGEQALEELRQHPDIDIIFTDINMAGMDGLTFLDRANEIRPFIKAIVISAYSDMSNIRAAMNRGAFDFLVKPIDFKDLDATVRKAARDIRELRRSLRSIEENDALRMFVDNSLMERLLPILRTSQEMSTEAVDGTVMCIDIYGVREYSRSADPHVLLEMLNQNFDVIVPAINSWNGRAVRFIGDMVMVVFQGEAHLTRACSAGVYIRNKLHGLAANMGPDSAYAQGVCIGIDSGAIVAGSIGSMSMRRLDYTILGDVVSAALWLQNHAERDQLLIAAPLTEQLGEAFEFEKVDGVQLTKHHETAAVYNIVAVDESLLGSLGEDLLAPFVATRTIAANTDDTHHE